MFGDVAIKLIKSMGHSGTVPGVIQVEDLPMALEQLQTSVRAEMAIDQDCYQGQASDESENYVSFDKRAKPLIELLEAAIEQNTDVMWDE